MDGAMIFGYIIAAIVSTVIWFYITQWMHEIDKRNRYMEAQIRLLSHIALKQEVDTDKVSDILVIAKLPPYTIGNKKEDQVRRIVLKQDLGLLTTEEFDKEKEAIHYQ